MKKLCITEIKNLLTAADSRTDTKILLERQNTPKRKKMYRPILGYIQYKRLKRQHYLKFCDSVSLKLFF